MNDPIRAARLADLRRAERQRKKARRSMRRYFKRIAGGPNAIAPTAAEQMARAHPAPKSKRTKAKARKVMQAFMEVFLEDPEWGRAFVLALEQAAAGEQS